MKRVFLAGLVVLLAWPGGTAAESGKVTVKMSPRDCRRLVRRHPSGDVAYRPGVDVRGKPVVPADLGGGSRLKLPKVISFDIKADLRNYLGGPEADAKAASAAVLAADKATAAASAANTAAVTTTAAAATATAAAADAAAKADLGTAATTATTTATAADNAADDTDDAVTDRNQAYDDAADIGANLGDAVVGKVKFNIMTGLITFNGEAINSPQQAVIAAGCRDLLKGRR